MNKFLATAAAVLSLTASAWAQQPVESERKPDPQRAEQMRAKYQERTQERFRKADSDGDGALSKAEAQAGMPRLAKDFDAIDTNKDGKITPDELRAHGARRHAQTTQRGDRPRRQDAEARKARFDQDFKRADTDGDGALSKAEAGKAMPRLARHFDAIDSNHDGKITQEEVKASVEKRRAERLQRDGQQRGPQGENK